MFKLKLKNYRCFTEEEFDFLNIEFVKSFAKKFSLDYEMQEQSSKTSNVLFILRKAQ